MPNIECPMLILNIKNWFKIKLFLQKSIQILYIFKMSNLYMIVCKKMVTV